MLRALCATIGSAVPIPFTLLQSVYTTLVVFVGFLSYTHTPSAALLAARPRLPRAAGGGTLLPHAHLDLMRAQLRSFR